MRGREKTTTVNYKLYQTELHRGTTLDDWIRTSDLFFHKNEVTVICTTTSHLNIHKKFVEEKSKRV